MRLSNKDRILKLLKMNSLTSSEVADKLKLGNQDTRTYLLRLKKEGKIKTLGKRGRHYIYTFNAPIDTQKTQIDTNMIVEILKDYLESAPSFKTEINKKIAKLEAKLNTLTSQTQESYILNNEIINIKKLEEIEEELEVLQNIEPPEKLIIRTPDIEKLDTILAKLITSIPEVKAASVVSVEGELIASALPQDVDEMTMAVMSAVLLSLAESAITLIKSGEFEQLFIQGRDGYLLVLPAGLKAVLSVSTTRDVRLGLIFLDCMQTAEKIANLI